MKVAIIIPVLNEALAIRSTLEPVQGLRARGYRLVVVDGGSADGTPELCQGLVDEVRQSRPGRASQMNTGARGQDVDVLLFLHADTRLPADADLQLMRFYNSMCDWGRFDVRLSGSNGWFRMIERMMNWRSRITGIATGDQALFVRRVVFEAQGGFANIPLMEDVEFSARLRQRSRPFCISSPVLTSSRRWEEQGTWKTILLMWRLRLDYWRGVPPTDLVKRYYKR